MRSSYPWGTLPICYSNLELPGRSGKTPALPRSQSVPAAPPSMWWRFLDAKYEKADIPAIIRENCFHLNASDREKLLSVLLRFELLFNGTLGDWNLPPVSFELKEGMKPYHGRPYPIPHVHKAILMKEIKRLCNIRVLVWQPSLQCASPTFIIPKKG